jgi:hypothetical protein
MREMTGCADQDMCLTVLSETLPKFQSARWLGHVFSRHFFSNRMAPLLFDTLHALICVATQASPCCLIPIELAGRIMERSKPKHLTLGIMNPVASHAGSSKCHMPSYVIVQWFLKVPEIVLGILEKPLVRVALLTQHAALYPQEAVRRIPIHVE